MWGTVDSLAQRGDYLGKWQKKSWKSTQKQIAKGLV